MLLLSEAIRLGATLSPQIRGMLSDDDGRTCAIGAALLATGNLKPRHIRANKLFPALGLVVEITPKGKPITLAAKVVNLNDRDSWSREQIADWIVEKGYDCEYAPPVIRQVKTQETVGEAVAV